ncbi:hypothetical protein TKK_0004883 [Trichogramma kaykai]
MDSKKDVIRVKEEPSDTVTNTADEFAIDLVGYCKSENFEPLSSHELSSNQGNEAKPLLDDLNETVLFFVTVSRSYKNKIANKSNVM